MVAILKEFPAFHVTFNLVPSLVSQLQEYARDGAHEQAFELAFKPANSLSPADREKLINFSFQLNLRNLVNRFPRLRELYDKVHAGTSQEIARLWVERDFLDLQVLSQLAWFDEIYLSSDEIVRNLVRKGRGYTEDDKLLVRNKEVEIFNAVLEEYKNASERGQIEISTSPFYHPILPLLCDSNIALESHPGIRLPCQVYRHPEDAVDQIREAVKLHENVFGSCPTGLWPSEGSVSDEVLQLAAREGFAWTATDEGILRRSLGIEFNHYADGTLEGARELYRPYSFSSDGRLISIFFRDHYLSDLIGFVYANMPPEAAAHDLHQRIRTAARFAGDGPKVVSIILDGENAWEFYSGNGREFLKSFYRKVSEDNDLKAVTASEALGLCEHGSLSHVVPGSWINANFDVWIGADEDNRAWEMLGEARDFFAHDRNRNANPSTESETAKHDVWISEGSDWCWWYGPEHSSGHDEEFDLLYRKHLSNIYRLLGQSPPDNLASPIKRIESRAVNYPPTGTIEPVVVGVVTNYFEWLGAGLYIPDTRHGSMHGTRNYVDALYYGYGQHALYLRLDFLQLFVQGRPSFETRIALNGDVNVRVHALVREGGVRQIEFWQGNESLLVPLATGDKLEANFSRTFEVRLDYDLMRTRPGKQIQVQISLWAGDLPLQIIPQEGWLNLELSEEVASW